MTKNTRYYHFDYLRAISAVFIIGIHASGILLQDTPNTSLTWLFGTIFQMIVRIGLPIFFIISGALILNGKDESLSDFYFKRVSKILIPLLIYSYFYLFIYYDKFASSNFYNFIIATRKVINGPVYYHLWFVYTIFGIYLFTPFIKKMLKNLTYKQLFMLILLIFLIRVNNNYLSVFGLSIGFNNLSFIDWNLYFILGYFLTHPDTIKFKKYIYLSAIICFILTFFIIRFMPKFNQNIYDLAPTMILISSGFFMFFESNKIYFKKNRIYNIIINPISKHSYSIYLIHAFVLSDIVNGKLGINGLTFNPVIGTFITVMITLIISLIISYLIDTVLINPINKLLNTFYKKLKNNLI